MSSNGGDHSEVRSSLTTVVRALVDRPDEVKVGSYRRGGSTILSLDVAPEDVGQVIGRQGRTARALRTLLEARSVEERRDYGLDIKRR